MKVTRELSLSDFEPWFGGKAGKDYILEHGLEEDFENLLEECYPNGIDETLLNDVLWFDVPEIFNESEE
jgi:hypothetical protein